MPGTKSSPTPSLSFGTLYIVPTPIGNLEDITLRALRILKEVSLICAEDTRRTKKLLNHYGISTQLSSYYREKEREKSVYLLSLLKSGESIALVSDAGTPAISDPGSILVAHAHAMGIPVVPLPGPSAATTAISASGLDCDGFLFLGFPPSKKGARNKFLHSIANSRQPVVLYESPRRIGALLTDAFEILGNREGFIARELTKTFEELVSDRLLDLSKKFAANCKGEFVLIIAPGEQDKVPEGTVEELLLWYRDNTEISVKDVSQKLAGDLGISKSIIYKQAISLWKTR